MPRRGDTDGMLNLFPGEPERPACNNRGDEGRQSGMMPPAFADTGEGGLTETLLKFVSENEADDELAAIAAGARQATHLFNRMPPVAHRAPGLAGAVLQPDDVAAEVICDNRHVHPAMVRLAVAAKRAVRVMAITDGTALAGMPAGTRAALGGRPITSTGDIARLDDGTMAGSVLTMDGAFRNLAGEAGLSLVDAATLCSTTPARELGLVGHGVLAPGAVADFVVLDRNLSVVQTYVAGRLVYSQSS